MYLREGLKKRNWDSKFSFLTAKQFTIGTSLNLLQCLLMLHLSSLFNHNTRNNWEESSENRTHYPIYSATRSRSPLLTPNCSTFSLFRHKGIGVVKHYEDLIHSSIVIMNQTTSLTIKLHEVSLYLFNLAQFCTSKQTTTLCVELAC